MRRAPRPQIAYARNVARATDEEERVRALIHILNEEAQLHEHTAVAQELDVATRHVAGVRRGGGVFLEGTRPPEGALAFVVCVLLQWICFFFYVRVMT